MSKEYELSLVDAMPHWQRQLVWDYGIVATVRLLEASPRLHPYDARSLLEQQRLAKEMARWALAPQNF